MHTAVFIMLIWAGTARGGPVAIQGFASLEDCERSRPVVSKFYEGSPERSRCAELPPQWSQ